MSHWTYNEVIEDWIEYLENTILPKNSYDEPGFNHKLVILDSILALNYLRKSDGNISFTQDLRLQRLFETCTSVCADDWFHRFLGYNSSKIGDNKNFWWLNCWETIRLNNVLHKFNYRKINDFFLESMSGGQEFAEKWEKFFKYSNDSKYESSSLPAFSYLECCLFALNVESEFSAEELELFLFHLCEKDGSNLKNYPKSLELRVKALNVLDEIGSTKIEHFDDLHKNLLSIIKNFIINSEWDLYSHSLATILFEIDNSEVVDILKYMMSDKKMIDARWVTGGQNYKRKPRFALLLTINEIEKKDYFELIEPNNFLYTQHTYLNNYIRIAQSIDNIIQSFETNKELKRKVQENDIREEFFQDLIITGLSGLVGDFANWVEKEKETGSGRISDIYLSVKNGPNIPIETKILWRFGNDESYNPIDETIEQTCQWNFGITIVFNPKSNPSYKKIYRGFEGWINWVNDHESFIPGTIKESNKYFSSQVHLKSKHFFSSHKSISEEREKIISLLNFHVDLDDYILSPSLKKIK